MGVYDDVDIAVSPSGDMMLGANKDFSLASGSGVLKQDIAFRLRTEPGDFIPHVEIGAGLEEIIGEPNTRETCLLGESKITRALNYDGMVASRDLFVKGVPISQEAIMYYVFVNNSQGVWNVTPDVVFTMMGGLTNIPGE